MKNKWIWILVAVLLVCNIGLVGYLVTREDAPVSVTCDADRFKSEYEALNSKDNG